MAGTDRLWSEMDSRPRRSMTTLTVAAVPEEPGYVLYRDGTAV